jgi:hypothetical protein
MRAKAGAAFYMYNSERFMEHAREYVKVEIKPESIKEIRDIRIRDEEQRLRMSEAIHQLYDSPADKLRFNMAKLGLGMGMQDSCQQAMAKLGLGMGVQDSCQPVMAKLGLGMGMQDSLIHTAEQAKLFTGITSTQETLVRASRDMATLGMGVIGVGEALRCAAMPGLGMIQQGAPGGLKMPPPEQVENPPDGGLGSPPSKKTVSKDKK